MLKLEFFDENVWNEYCLNKKEKLGKSEKFQFILLERNQIKFWTNAAFLLILILNFSM